MDKTMKKKNVKKMSTLKSIKKGIVVSDKMDKTVVVKVDLLKKHPKYKKRYISSKKYKVHDEKNQAKVGDKVIFELCVPLSKDKCWKIVS